MKKNYHGLVIAGAVAVSLFAGVPVVYAAVPTVSSAKITGANTATIVYAEPVSTGLSDYANFSGALGGRNLTGLSGSGNNTVVLTFDGVAFVPDATGGLSIASTTISMSDHSAFRAGTISISDGQIPLLTSVTVSSGGGGLPLARAGGSIMLTFSTNESITSPTVTILGHQIAAIGGSNGPYTVNYVMSSTDAEGMVPVTVSMSDNAGNAGKITFSLANSNAVVPAPVITPSALPMSFGVGTPTSSVGAVVATTTLPMSSGVGTAQDQVQALLKQLEQKKAELSQAATTPSAALKFARPLIVGSIGDDVKELQKRLTDEGFYKGVITGKFGAQTRDAVKAYQKKHRLTQLGTVGPGTRALLNK